MELKPGEDFFGSLLNIMSKVDFPKGSITWEEQRRESAFDFVTQRIIEMTSEEEILFLFQFINNYSDIGGNSFEYLYNSCKDRDPITKNIMIHFAAIYDELNPGGVQSRVTGNPCLDMILREVAKNVLIYGIDDALIDGVGLATGNLFYILWDLGVDIADITMYMIQYEECMRNMR